MPLAPKIILLATVLLAAILDVRYRRIPNWLNLSALVLGIGSNILLFHIHGFVLSLLGLGCSLIIYVPLYLLRGMGAGDVKLMAAVGSITGPWNWFCIFLLTALLGGFVSFIYVAWRGRLQHTLLNLGFLVAELAHARVPAVRNPHLDTRHSSALRLPHGAVIAAGTGAFLYFAPKALSSLF